MPQISFDSQGFAIGGRRIWMMGAAVESALTPTQQWSSMLTMLRQRGFNTIRTSAPWHLHEMRRGRTSFEGSLNLGDFVRLCREQGMWVILRIGPAVGGTFSGGGLPAWLSEIEGLRPHEPSDEFLQLVSRWYGTVLAQIKGLDASVRGEPGRAVDGAGGVLAVQIDHGWECGNTKVAERYLTELRRFVREAGVEVPVLTANGLWAGAEETIDVWQGGEDLFAHVRQLRRAQPHAPALVEITPAHARRRSIAASSSRRSRSDNSTTSFDDPNALQTQVGRVIAAGGQAIVAHATPEVHRAVPAGAELDGALTSDSVRPALIDHRLQPSAAMCALAPLALFVSNFGATVSGDSGSEAVVIDPDHPVEHAPIVVSRSANAGTVAFVMSERDAGPPARSSSSARGRRTASTRDVTLVTADGMRLPVTLGAHSFAWFPIGLDLHGRARLDYAGLSPVAFIDRSMLILFGPPGVRALVSIDGSERMVETPAATAGARPRALAQGGLTLLICNEAQAAAMLVDAESVVIGADRIDTDGSAVRSPSFSEVIRVDAKGRLTTMPSQVLRVAGDKARPRVVKGNQGLGPWSRADATPFAAGTSARFASIETPRSLAEFAPSTGLGWYRLRIAASKRETMLWLPGAGGALLAMLDGRPFADLGRGTRLPLRISSSKGERDHVLVLLAVDSGRAIHGLASSVSAGVSGPAWEVVPVRVRTKSVMTPSFDPFERRAFVPLAPGTLPEKSLEVAFSAEKATPVVIDPGCAFYGAVLVNGRQVDVFDRPQDAVAGITLGPGVPGWSSGPTVVTLVPMRSAPTLERSLRVYSRVAVIESARRAAASWAFARWEIPDRASSEWTIASEIRKTSGGVARSPAGIPAWWMARATATGACNLLLTGLSSGAIFIDGAPMGRYDTKGDPCLPLPHGVLEHGADLVIFDERGAVPASVSLMLIMSQPDAKSS